MFIRNTWYVVAEPQEVVEGKILARTILNEFVVLYRTSDGKAVAMHDACPHRFAPLSLGSLENDTIRCPYHGARYDSDGKCVEVAGQTGEHGKACVKSYPIIERHNYIWIWMGDPELASDESSIPDWFYVADHPDWNGGQNKFLSLPFYYELINDNLHDMTHTQFVHPETLGTDLNVRVVRLAKGEETEGMYMERDIQKRSIHLHAHLENIQSGPTFHHLLASSKGQEKWDDNITWDIDIHYATPSYFCFNPQVREVGAPDADVAQFHSLNAITPETDTSCHYFFYTANNFKGTKQHEMTHTKLICDSIDFAFEQDKVLLSEQMKRVPDLGMNISSMTNNSFMGDMIPIQGRKMIQALIAAEQTAAK